MKNPVTEKSVKNNPAFPISAILFFLTINTYCQEINQSDITDIAEDLVKEETNPEAATKFLEQLHELSENRVKLNTADETEISRLFFLSDFQVRSIADHIKTTGQILSVYEIASIPGFDQRTAIMMEPFITLEKNSPLTPDPAEFHGRLITNLSVKSGDSDTSYPGSPWKILTKYKIYKRRLSAGFTAEKDAGEKLFPVSVPVTDFLSGYIEYSGPGFLRKVITGDFSAKFGQGTAVNTGIHTGIPLTTTGYFPARNEIKPYTSTDENNFFRGLATELATGKMNLTLLASYNKIDATLSTSGDSAITYIDNLYIMGLHNTPSSLNRRDVVSEIFYGLNINTNLSTFTFGMNWSESIFSLPFDTVTTDPADIYDFKGKKRSTLSAYYSGHAGKSLIYGEFSTFPGKNYAIVQGFTLRPSGRLSINFLYRKYSPGSGGLHSMGPGSSSSGCNEEGFLGNFTFEAARNFFVSAGYDLCQYPWLKYRTSFPSMSKRSEIKLTYRPSDNLNLEISYNYRFALNDAGKERGIAGKEEVSSGTLKTLFRYSLNEKLTINCRIDYKTVNKSGGKGILMSDDLIYRLKKIPCSIWARYCLFNTDTWDSRLYMYENDMLYSYSIPAFSGKGSRSYIMVKWEFGNFAELRIKYGQTSTIQSYGIMEGRNEMRFQFRIWF